MNSKKTKMRFLFYGALVLALAGLSVDAYSIQREPIKVTHKNAGPSYSLDRDFEPDAATTTTASPASANDEPKVFKLPAGLENSASSSNPDEPSGKPERFDTPFGHVTIRRIFLIPVGGPNDRMESPFSSSPLWPLLMAPRDPQQSSEKREKHHHLFGSDEASRSPSESSSEREGDEQPIRQPDVSESENKQTEAAGPIADPLQLMVEMMRAMAHQMMVPPPERDMPSPPATPETALDTTDKPKVATEAKDEVVEIGGKKYLRKIQVTKHVGDNMLFLTRRLVFVPLNETESDATTTTTTAASTLIADEQPASTTTAAPTTTTTTAAPTTTTTTTAAASDEATSKLPELVEREKEEPATTGVMTEVPSTNAPAVDDKQTSPL